MSHQDQGRCNETCFHFQALREAINWLWQDIDFSGLRLRSDCTWSARALVTAALFWSWSDELTLVDRFRKARQIACKSLGIRNPPASSYQAFLKLLNKWTPHFVELLTLAFRRRMKQRFPDRLRIAGFFAFGADGSRIELPRTRSNEEAYAAACSKRSRKRKRNPIRKTDSEEKIQPKSGSRRFGIWELNYRGVGDWGPAIVVSVITSARCFVSCRVIH